MEIINEGQNTAAFVRANFLAITLIFAPVGAVFAQVPGGDLGGSQIDDQVEDQVEDDVEDQIEEDTQDQVTDITEDEIQESVEDAIDELVVGQSDWGVEEQIEEEVEEEIAQEIEEELVEETVEEALEEAVEEQVADTVTDEVENNVEESVEEAVEESVADNVEEVVQEQVEDVVQEEVAQNVESSVESEVEQNVESAVEDAVETEVAASVESVVEVQVADSVEERLESEIDDILDDLESNLDVDENRIKREQWLVMAEPEVFEELAEQGYLFDAITDLPALGMRLAEVAGPSSFDITEVRRGVLDVVGKDRAEVDLNHIYTAGAEVAVTRDGVTPRAAMSLPAVGNADAPRIGMIDSKVDTSHPALVDSHIQSRSFVPASSVIPEFHGTAIASIIAANSKDYQGLAPGAELYAAAVFEQDQERGEIASTVSLLRALDWLISSEVDVVNISLAGPPNKLLEAALKKAYQQNVLVLAAAGNGGPVAKPMYPAAYDYVVAVTAVDTRNQVFRLANRGTYLDIAAPGVGLLHARAGGGYMASSGTSFAVPFAATAAANLVRTQPGVDVMSLLYQSAEDLGAPGRDEIYGYGLLRFSGS